MFALIMAGGAGTRFWPMSRQGRPKQLLPLVGGRSLLAATVERLLPLLPVEQVIVATGARIAAAVCRDLPALPAANVVAEPSGRDTAACVGLVAWRLARDHADAAMVVLPADHVIPDGAALRAALVAAVTTAVERGGLVTLALRPTRPETGFGYLQLGERAFDAAGLPVHPVERFVEKPGLERARELLATGRSYWNSGMFAWSVATIVAAFRHHLPALAAGLDELMEVAREAGDEVALERCYPGLERISVDYGVMEKAQEVFAVPVDFAWSDVGSWPGLAEVLEEAPCGVSVGDVLAVESERCVLVSDGPLVATLGVTDLVVVATRDAVLVVPREQTQRVRELVAELQRRGRDELV